ncbi:MmgE/PrpD family protein, partial [Rhizobium ruizarguesonis]
LRCNVGWHIDWNLSTVVGCFSATAAGGSIFKLDPTQLANALGIASLQSSGTIEQIFGLGSDLRGMYAGFSSQASVNAVRLAARGMTGIRSLLEGEAG